MFNFSRASIVCGLLTFIAFSAQATTVKSLSVETMAQEADTIIEGRVIEKESRWNQQKTRIYTFTQINVTTSHKGNEKSGTTLQVRQIGGDIDGLSQRVVGNAEFTVGEDVLVFPSKDPASNLHFVVGMAQGKFAIDRTVTPPQVFRSMQGLNRLGSSHGMHRVVMLKQGAVKKHDAKGHPAAEATLHPLAPRPTATLPNFRTRVLEALRPMP